MMDWHSWQPRAALLPAATAGLAISMALLNTSRHSANPKRRFLLVLIPTVTAFSCVRDLSPDDKFNEIFARFLIIWLAHQWFLHCFLAPEQLDVDRRRFIEAESTTATTTSTSNKPEGDKPDRSWKYAYKLLVNTRCINTPWEVRSLPGRDPATASTAKRSRTVFLIRRLLVLSCRYIALCVYYDPALYSAMPEGGTLATYPDVGNPAKGVVVRRLLLCGAFSSLSSSSPSAAASAPYYCHTPLTMRDLLVRAHLVVHTILPDYLILSSYHDVLAIVAVGVGLDSPEEWPPLFGSLLDAYSVRNYWSRFWHRLVYRSYGSIAWALAARVPGLRGRRGPVARHVNGFLIFLISGLVHTLVEWQLQPAGEDGAAPGRGRHWFATLEFCLQFVGVACDELLRQAMHALVERQLSEQTRRSALYNALKRTSGYAWTLAWLLWSWPKIWYLAEASSMG